jgi:HPt (histidine-containing phosphotransfer) domain-containing protein
MELTETILFYLLFGIGIAAAVALAREGGGRGERLFRIATAVFFWPLYLPILLDGAVRSKEIPPARLPAPDLADLYATAIAQVEAELETALDSLDGWAENVLGREQDRFAELRAAWRLQAQRIRQLDRLLAATEETGQTAIAEPALGTVPGGNERYRQSGQARQENLERLRSVRGRLHDDLLGTLAWVRELVSMIHLAKFTGAPASRAEELVAQIATAVEGLSEVTQWREEAALGK